MTGLAASFVLQAAMLASGAQPYQQAFTEAQTGGRPLMVLVGADWCPGCVVMKQSVLARMHSAGRLNRVAYATVNTDTQSTLAGRLMRGSSIPQLIIYSQDSSGQWHREQVNGAISEGQVEQLISRAVATQRPAAPKANETAKY